MIADGVALVSARPVAAARCSSTTQVNLAAPVVLGIGGFLVLLALAAKLATPGAGRPRWGLFLTAWVLAVIAFAASGFALYFASTFRLCG